LSGASRSKKHYQAIDYDMSTHPITSNSFVTKADQYLRDDCTQPPLVDHIQIAPLIGNISGSKILCVGCGGGSECASFASKGAVVEGVDISEMLLREAQQKSPSVSFKLASVESLPYQDKSFDLVYCAHVFHYLKDWELALKEIFRVCNDTGRAFITLHHPFDQGHFGGKKTEVQTSWYDNFEVVYYPRSISEMLESFISVGFLLTNSVEIAGELGKAPIIVAFALNKPDNKS